MSMGNSIFCIDDSRRHLILRKDVLLDETFGTGSDQEISDPFQQPDFIFNIQLNYTNNATSSGKIKIEGEKPDGNFISEDLEIDQNSRQYTISQHLFKKIKKITIPSGLSTSDSIWIYAVFYLNGIDYLEVELISQNESKLYVYFLKPISPTLAEQLQKKEYYKITGGVRVTNVGIETIEVSSHNNSITLTVNTAGDFSFYNLKIDAPLLDRMFSQQIFNFKAECPSHFDCKPNGSSESLKLEEPPVIDYMAKDYSSFRQVLMDFISSKYRFWTEYSEADIGMMLVDLFSYMADRLSYYQDSVANEAYLETARQRVSVKRHAQLIDYRMHDGFNSKTYLYFNVNKDGEVPANTKVSTNKGKNEEIVFETEEPIKVYEENNRLNIYTWGNNQCYLPKGTTSLHLKTKQAQLKTGDYIVFVEEKNYLTGKNVDKDPKHRWAVKLTEVTKTYDPIDDTKLLYVKWSQNEALNRDFWVSTISKDGKKIIDITVILGNIIPASHGETIEEFYPKEPISLDEEGFKTIKDGKYYLDNQTWYEIKNKMLSFKLHKSPLTFYSKPIEELNESISSLEISVKTQGNNNFTEVWTEKPTLIRSKPFDKHYIIDVDEYGKAAVRFGDGIFGQALSNNAFIKAKYRIGCGNGGNVGLESLTFLKNKYLTFINSVTNILPAKDGEDLETINQVKLLAPKAFHIEQKRAVTEEDYAKVAELHPQVSKAQARFRWTGSWYTVFIMIDPKGYIDFNSEFKKNIQAHISKYRLAGYDIKITKPEYVPLEININICIDSNYFKAHVKKALMKLLSNKELADGKKGFFHPDNFTFGQPVYLSHIYKTIEEVEGVDSAEITVFRRFGKSEINEIYQGYISTNKLEIAQLDNDLNYPENGVLNLNMMGGK